MKNVLRLSCALTACTLTLIAGCQSESRTTSSPATTASGTASSSYYWQSSRGDAQPVATQQAAPRTPAPKARPTESFSLTAWPSQQSDNAIRWNSLAYPGRTAQDSVIGIEKGLPAQARLNQPFDYQMIVTNLTNHRLHDVVVSDVAQNGMKILLSSPEGSAMSGGGMKWDLGTLEGGESKTVNVTAQAQKTGSIGNCTTVSYNSQLCSTVEVVAPKLAITKSGPAEVLRCEDITYRFVVANTGTGAINDVKVVETLPRGLVTTDGKSVVERSIGTLRAGEQREFFVKARAESTGTFTAKAAAMGAGDISANSGEVKTVVREPKLVVTTTGPASRFIGRVAEYQIVVKNTGDGVARNTIVEDALPAGARFVDASSNGQLVRGTVRWNLGTLKPDESRTITVRLNTERAGTFRRSVKAVADCANEARAASSTEFAGIPAILLEVIDVTDPVAVGENETYVITATNQGSAPDTNIRIACTLEGNMSFVSATGASRGDVSNAIVTFQPLRSLAPGQKASWRVVVKAVKPGDVRFKVSMNTDNLTRPVEETEATNVYE